MTSGVPGPEPGSHRCLALPVASAGREVASSRLERPRGNATAFKIRRAMFVAEQNLRQLRVLWEGPPAASLHLFLHILRMCRGCRRPSLSSALSQGLTLPVRPCCHRTFAALVALGRTELPRVSAGGCGV